MCEESQAKARECDGCMEGSEVLTSWDVTSVVLTRSEPHERKLFHLRTGLLSKI
jgi:hypothetical protein